MMFLLSHARMAIFSSENIVRLNAESSVRKLFGVFSKSRGFSAVSVSSPQKQLPETYGQSVSSSGQNITMKRGDWICPRCTDMNFAKNSYCRQCEEPRPNRILTGREWACPQCDYFNFGRNIVCLRCDCKRPAADPPQSSDIILSASNSSVTSNMERGLAENDKHQQWSTKVTQLDNSTGFSNTMASAAYPKTKQSGDDQFDLGKRNMGVDGNSEDDNHDINVEISRCLDEIIGDSDTVDGTTEFSDSARLRVEKGTGDEENSVSWFRRIAKIHDEDDTPGVLSDEESPGLMPMRRGESRFVVSKKKDRSLTSPMHKRRMAMEQSANNNKYVPFVPFPPGYFAREKSDELSSQSHQGDSKSALANANGTVRTSNQHSSAMNSVSEGLGERIEDGNNRAVHKESNSLDETQKSLQSSSGYSRNDASAQMSESQSIRDSWRGKSLEGSLVREPDPLDMSEEAKAERWFRRIAQIKDISELSQIPDEDFPSIMPMRKGVNRFVVSKRKTPLERRLISSKYRRNLPSEISDSVKKEGESS